MNDLISRSELLEEIKSLSIVLNGKQIFSDDAKDTVLRIISEQPTAYDVNKVVEELKELKMRYFLTNANTGDEKSDFAYENVGNALDKAIEIVKQGGSSDDVCEWKQDNMCETVYRVCGGCFTSAYQKDFKFCPYCGKKIKVVEKNEQSI